MPWWAWTIIVIFGTIFGAIAMFFIMIAGAMQLFDDFMNIDSLSDSTIKKMDRQNKRDERKASRARKRNLRKETNA